MQTPQELRREIEGLIDDLESEVVALERIKLFEELKRYLDRAISNAHDEHKQNAKAEGRTW